MNDKIKPQHLSRKAILYVRQSSAYQVSHNLESQRLQYAMQDRLQQLGWREIEVVDEDLGRSAAGLVARSGFERMVADVCLGKVGAVAALSGGSNLATALSLNACPYLANSFSHHRPLFLGSIGAKIGRAHV